MLSLWVLKLSNIFILFKMFTATAYQEAQVKIKSGIITTLKYVEPPIMKHRRELQGHLQRISRMDNEVVSYRNARKGYIEEYTILQTLKNEQNFNRHVRVDKKAAGASLLRDMKTSAEAQDRAHVLKVIEEKRKEWITQSEEELVKKETQHSLRLEKAMEYKRKMDIEYWTIQSKKKTSHESNDTIYEKEESEEELRHRKQVKDEKEYDHGVEKDQEKKEYDQEKKDNEKNNILMHTSPCPTGGPFNVEHELKRTDLMEKQSIVNKLVCEKEQLKWKVRENLQLKNHFNLQVERIQLEMNQLYTEKKERESREGDPSASDISFFHTLQNIKSSSQHHLDDLKIRLQRVQKTIQESLCTITTIEKRLLIAQQHSSILQEEIRKCDDSLLELPAIVGISIKHQKIALKNIERIKAQSKFQIIQSGLEPTLKAYDQSRSMKFDAWMLDEKLKLDRFDLQQKSNKLNELKERILSYETASVRSDIARAIDRFHVRTL